MSTRRKLIGLAGPLAAALALLAGSPAIGQSFPSGPITFVVAWPAGGGSDVSMRILCDSLSKKIGQPVVVVNKPGAGGAIGHREIASAKPDGYTIGVLASGAISLPYLNAQANLVSDFEPLAFFGEDPAALQVNPSVGIGTLKEYVERAKAQPGKIRNGNDQPGGSSFIAANRFEKEMGFKLTKVSYGGFAPTVVALMSGEVDSATVPIPDSIEQHRAGKLKILGVAGTERHALAPEIPTFKEQGFNVVVGSWRAIVGPKGMPEDRIRYLEGKLIEAMRDPEFVDRAKKAGFLVSPDGAKATAERFQKDDAELYPILLDAGLVKARQKS